nr:Gag-Pol precursor [Tanacetum cinerariifolium]
MLDGLKMPSHMGSYDGKADPNNYLYLFEGAIHMQKWAMLVTCHMFTYTLKESAWIWWNGKKACSIVNYEDLKAKFRTAMQKMGIVVSTIHAAIKFHTPHESGTVFSIYEPNKVEEGYTKKPFNTEHKLNEYKHINPVKQKRRGLASKRSEAACKEVDELTNAGILQEVKGWSTRHSMIKSGKTSKPMLRSINMNLNLKKCSFGVVEGPFLGDLITKQGIKANPLKVIVSTSMKPLRRLKEIQSLNGKPAALIRFLSKGAKKSLLFFKALKSCTDVKTIQRSVGNVSRGFDRKHKCRSARKERKKTSFDLLRKQGVTIGRTKLPRIGKAIISPCPYNKETSKREKVRDMEYEELRLKCEATNTEFDKNHVVSFLRKKIKSLLDEIKEYKASIDRILLAKNRYQENLANMESKVAAIEDEKNRLEAAEATLRQEVESVKGDREEVVLKMVPYVAMELVHSDEMAMLVGKLISSAIFYGRCVALEEFADMKEPFELANVKESNVSPPSNSNEAQSPPLLALCQNSTLSSAHVLKPLSPPLATLRPRFSSNPSHVRKICNQYHFRLKEDKRTETKKSNAANEEPKSESIWKEKNTLTLLGDAAEMTEYCTQCQAYSTTARMLNNDVTTVNNTWSFSHWGINIVKPQPTAPGNLKFLAIAVEHFTKWIENTTKGRHVEKFKSEHVICRFGFPQTITLKDEKQFTKGIFASFCKGLKIRQSFFPITEHVEIINYVGNQLVRSQQGWVDDLP